MAEQTITIRTKTELSALRQLEDRLEKEIVQARVLGKEFGHLEQQLSKVRAGIQKMPPASRMGGDLMSGRIGKAASGLAGYVGGAITAGAITSAAARTLEYAGNLKDVADASDVAADNIQAFRKAADGATSSAAEADKALVDFNEKVGAARNGNKELADTFDRLNIKLVDSQNKTRGTNDIFLDTVNALAQISNLGDRATIAMDLFGKGGRNLATAFDGGSEALRAFRDEMEANGKLITSRELENLERYEQQVKNMRDSIMQGGTKWLAGLGTAVDYLQAFKAAKGSTAADDNIFLPVGWQQIFADFEAGMIAIADIETKLEQESAKVAENKRRAAQATKQEVEDKKRLVEMEKEWNAEQKAAEQGLNKDQLRKEGAQFQNIEEVIAAGDDPRATPAIKRDAEIAKRVKFLREQANLNRGFDPQKAEMLTLRADETERHIGGLASSKKANPEPLRVPEIQTEATAQAAHQMTVAQAKANEELVKFMEAGTENARMTAMRLIQQGADIAEINKKLLELQRRNITRP